MLELFDKFKGSTLPISLVADAQNYSTLLKCIYGERLPQPIIDSNHEDLISFQWFNKDLNRRLSVWLREYGHHEQLRFVVEISLEMMGKPDVDAEEKTLVDSLKYVDQYLS